MTDLRRVVFAALLATPACMRIYPDPDLPDVVADWNPECPDGATTVRIEAVTADGEATTDDFACSVGAGRLEDLERERHTVTLVQLDARGEILGRSYPYPADLRDGLSERIERADFTRDEGMLHATWAFADGASCASLDADTIAFEFASADGPPWETQYACALYEGVFGAPPGTYTVRVRVQRTYDGPVVATSAPITGVVVRDRGEVTELGEVVLTR